MHCDYNCQMKGISNMTRTGKWGNTTFTSLQLQQLATARVIGALQRNTETVLVFHVVEERTFPAHCAHRASQKMAISHLASESSCTAHLRNDT